MGSECVVAAHTNDELETTVKRCGTTRLDQVHPGFLNTLAVDLIPGPEDHPYAKWRPAPKKQNIEMLPTDHTRCLGVSLTTTNYIP